MQPLSWNQRPDLLTARWTCLLYCACSSMNMSLVLRLPQKMHLCRSSSDVPHLTFDKVQGTSTSKNGAYMWCFVHFDFETRFAPQRRALFRHLNFQKWSEAEVFCAFWLGNALRATTACTFSSYQLLKVLRRWGVLYILTWTCASRHNGVQFFISHLASWLRTRRISEPTFRPSGATNQWKNTVFRDFPAFSRTWIFFSSETFSFLFFFFLFFSSLLFSSLLFSDSSHLCFSSVHIVGSLTSKLPSARGAHGYWASSSHLLPWIFFASHVCVLYICCLVLSARMRGRYLRGCQHGFTCRPSDLLEHFLFSQKPHVFEQLLFQKTLAVTHHSSMDSQILLLWLYADACSARVIGFWLIRHTDHLEKVNRSTSRLVIAEHVRKLKLRLSVSSRQFPSCKMNRDHWNIYWHILKHIGTYRKHIEFDSEVYISLSESRNELMCSSN